MSRLLDVLGSSILETGRTSGITGVAVFVILAKLCATGRQMMRVLELIQIKLVNSRKGTHLNFVWSHKAAIICAALKVALALDAAIILAQGLIILYSHPMPTWKTLNLPNVPETKCEPSKGVVCRQQARMWHTCSLLVLFGHDTFGLHLASTDLKGSKASEASSVNG